MGTYDGMKFLRAQLASIWLQTVPRVDIHFSDDGSTDGTVEFLGEVVGGWNKGEVTVSQGPGDGFPENYRQMIVNAEPGYRAYAFSDQDDVWHYEKLQRAMDWLATVDPAKPALYCGRTRIVTHKGEPTGFSPLFSRKPSFQNAIVQSLAGGNTMVMNDAAREIIAESCRRTPFVTHDWWSYLVVSGAGGVVYYDEKPTVDYRQHDKNLIGANSSWRARMLRILLMAGGRFAVWNQQNSQALAKCDDLLNDNARQCLYEFDEIRRNKSVVNRTRMLGQSGIYRQTTMGQISLYGASILGKL